MEVSVIKKIHISGGGDVLVISKSANGNPTFNVGDVLKIEEKSYKITDITTSDNNEDELELLVKQEAVFP